MPDRHEEQQNERDLRDEDRYGRSDLPNGRSYEETGRHGNRSYGREGGYSDEGSRSRPLRGDYGPNQGDYRDYARDAYLYGTGRNLVGRGYVRTGSSLERDLGPEYTGGFERVTDRSERGYGYGYAGAGSEPRGNRTHGEDDVRRSYNREQYLRDQETDRSRSDRSWWERASDEVSAWLGDEAAEHRRRMDQFRSHHRGRGPKGYQRSDARILEDVNDRLTDDIYLDASEIEVSVQGGEVILSGTVDQRRDKRRAEYIAEDVSGVKNVENRLRVNLGANYRNSAAPALSAAPETNVSAAAAGASTANRTKGMT